MAGQVNKLKLNYMEFKCRCWDKVLKQMFIPDMINKYGDVRHRGIALSKESENYYSKGEEFDTWLLKYADCFDLMFYSQFNFNGLEYGKYKLGDKMYENDLVELIISGQRMIHKIVFSIKEFGFENIKTKEFIPYNLNIVFFPLGNIYENPELLNTK